MNYTPEFLLAMTNAAKSRSNKEKPSKKETLNSTKYYYAKAVINDVGLEGRDALFADIAIGMIDILDKYNVPFEEFAKYVDGIRDSLEKHKGGDI